MLGGCYREESLRGEQFITKQSRDLGHYLIVAISHQGVRLELCARNTVGLLPYITRILREYGLTVARADIATQGEKTSNVFYVQDISGDKVDMGIFGGDEERAGAIGIPGEE